MPTGVPIVLAVSAVLVAALAIRAHYLDESRRWQVYVSKPLATLLILALGSVTALAAAAGAGLFVVSDGVLAIDRFRWPFRAARAVTLATYWSAQLLIALSVSAG